MAEIKLSQDVLEWREVEGEIVALDSEMKAATRLLIDVVNEQALFDESDSE